MNNSDVPDNTTSQIGGNDAVSNTQIDIMKRISEAKAQRLARTMVAEYCISMKKNMVSNVGTIVDGLNITNQTEIFEKVANQFFDDKLTDMYISELKATMKVQLKNNLRGILYNHFKLDLDEEKKREKELEEAAEQEGGEDAAGGPPKEAADEEVGDEETADEEASPGAPEGESSSVPEVDDGAMVSEIVNRINDKILTDDDFMEEAKKGILSNLESGTFKMALQREVFDRLVPQLESLMKEKIKSILEDDELKKSAMDVIKGQQKVYNAQFKKGGKKYTIKKDRKNGGNYTRKLN